MRMDLAKGGVTCAGEKECRGAPSDPANVLGKPRGECLKFDYCVRFTSR